jgi:hypothetical protein
LIIGRLNKETTDTSRFIGDLSWWLDPGETFLQVVSQSISMADPGWSVSPYPPPGVVPYDPTPVLIETCTFDETNTQLIMFFTFGTPGNAYQASIVLQGTSARVVTVEVEIQCIGTPPVEPLPVPVPAPTPPQPALALSITGGIMQGPLYLYEDPVYPTEAATKAYVDENILEPPGLEAETQERINADNAEQDARTQADAVLQYEMSTFRFGGTVASGQESNTPVCYPLVIPYMLDSTTVYAMTAPTDDAIFAVNQISFASQAVTELGQITITAGSQVAVLLNGPGGTLYAGDVLQIKSQTADATLADVVISIRCGKLMPG